ncbi:tRNA dihydrouridine synthase DusB, partial [Candidatus Woesearchaeota archaeon]|nr:tRNA dihydrouridine synthase DusB [Candidatus Woesearchaeota archaeon]MBT4630948.1 tRNA dihydrouridine synthase DusB [Candidatus Woesearchaeota archaeon]
PYIFKQINDYLQKGDYKEVTKKDKIKFFKEYLELAERYQPKFRYIKYHAMYMTKGIKGGKELRLRLSQTKDIKEIRKILQI